MQNQAILYGVVGLLAGSLLTIMISSKGITNQNYPRMMGLQRATGMMNRPSEFKEWDNTADGHMGMGSSMTEMMESLTDKTGDEFDNAFITAMIAHHEGAVEMAKVAQTNAKHDEIKQLAQGIIEAQNKEIIQMQGWFNAWGY